MLLESGDTGHEGGCGFRADSCAEIRDGDELGAEYDGKR